MITKCSEGVLSDVVAADFRQLIEEREVAKELRTGLFVFELLHENLLVFSHYRVLSGDLKKKLLNADFLIFKPKPLVPLTFFSIFKWK